MAFLLHFDELFELYHDALSNPADFIPDHQKKTHLETAVFPAPNLRAVAVREVEDTIRHGVARFSYDQYFLCLETAAQLHDGGDSGVRRRAHHTEFDPPSDVPYDADSEGAPARDAYEATQRRSDRPRLPDAKWSRLSSNAKSHWNSMTDTDKAVFLGDQVRSVNFMTTDPDPSTVTEPETTTDSTPADPGGSQSDRTVHHTQAQPAPRSAIKPSKPTPAIGDAHPGDPRRLLSTQNKASSADTRSAHTVRVASTNWIDDSIQHYWDTEDTFYDAQDF